MSNPVVVALTPGLSSADLKPWLHV